MNILLIEDHPDLGDAIESKLRNTGHRVEWVTTAKEALFFSSTTTWDALVLDITLPDQDGFAVLRQLRNAGIKTPVLVITARAEVEDKIDMLDLGADDYLVKPFDLREMEARLRALVRRPSGFATNTITVGNITLDLTSRTAQRDGELLELGRREFSLLEILTRRIGHAIHKERLMDQLFSVENASHNALELLVSRLRKKLQGSSIDIITIRGNGYLAKHNEDT